MSDEVEKLLQETIQNHAKEIEDIKQQHRQEFAAYAQLHGYGETRSDPNAHKHVWVRGQLSPNDYIKICVVCHQQETVGFNEWLIL